MWFPGAHSDVGGGYVEWTKPNATGLSFLPLAWMMQRLQRLIIDTPAIADPMPFQPAISPNPNAPIPFHAYDLLDPEGGAGSGPFDLWKSPTTVKPEYQELALAEQHRPWAAAGYVGMDACRLINQVPLPGSSPQEAAGRVPFSDAICEMVRVSALKRLQHEVATKKNRIFNFFGTRGIYKPKNLNNIIPYLAASYIRLPGVPTPWRDIVKPMFTWKESRIVGWNGKPLDPNDRHDVERAFALLLEPAAIGVMKRPEAMEYILDQRVK